MPVIAEKTGGGTGSTKKEKRAQRRALVKKFKNWTSLAMGFGRTAVAYGFMPFIVYIGFTTEPRPS